MGSAFRKLFVLLAALALALGLFLLYNSISGTPKIDFDRKSNFSEGIEDSNIAGFKGRAGKIGDNVQVEYVEDTVFYHYDANGAVDRKIGFQTLLHEVKDIWEVEKPFMSVIQRNFECHISSDKGSVQLETSLGNPTPKDATFTDNVVVHIVPKGTEKFKECFIYLDTIVFLSDKSQFSTIGPVRFVSETAHMLGRGLEFVYDEQAERLEYLRLYHLKTLKIKTLADALLSDGKVRIAADNEPNAVTPPEADETLVTVETTAAAEVTVVQPVSDSSAIAANSEKPEPSIPAETDAGQDSNGQYYRCILSKNVLINAPKQVIFAAKGVSINDIFWSTSTASSEEQSSGEQIPVHDTNEPALPKQTIESDTPSDQATVTNAPAETSVQPLPSTLSAAEPNQPAPKIVDIVVTCDNGILLVPENSRKSITDFPAPNTNWFNVATDPVGLVREEKDKTSFITETVDYSVSTRNTIAVGYSELTFLAEGATGSDANNTKIPVNITADKGVQYLHTDNKVIFDANCLCTMPQRDLSVPKDATLSSPKIIVDLLRSDLENASTSADITALGPVKLQFHVEDPNAGTAKSDPVPVIVTASKHARYLSATEQVIFEQDCVCRMPQQGMTEEQSYTLTSPTLTVNMVKTGSPVTTVPDVVAGGPVNLTFYVADFGGSTPGAAPLPATVTAQKNARFSALDNEIIFDGSCVCRMDRTDPNGQHEYLLESPTLTIALPEDSNDRPQTASSSGIERLTAHGGQVVLATRRWPADSDRSEGQLLGGVVLRCRQFDYDPNEEVLTATGPGVIRLNNSKVDESDPNLSRTSLRKPCFAVIQNFDTLKYFMRENHIIADATSKGSLLVNYFPLTKGQISQHIIITAGHFEANLYETDLGDLELSSLIATQGISCEDDSNKNQFEGSDLFYDHSVGIMTITGNESMPCMANGALVEAIRYDVLKNEVEWKVIGGGFQLGR